MDSSRCWFGMADAQILLAERAQLAQGAAELAIEMNEAQQSALLRLIDALEAGNAQFNLTAIRDRPGMLRKHLLDSLSLQSYLRGKRIADIGTGAGFPGLPLAIMNPSRHFALVEATAKKARYVAETAALIGVRNVEIVNQRAESYRPQEPFDTVIARALSSLEAFIAFAGHLCAADGRLLAMKGRRNEEEIAALPRGFRVLAVHRLRVPGLTDERHLIEIVRARTSGGGR
jgi:16S rRNA (guanine527-N7)-methyltransferase